MLFILKKFLCALLLPLPISLLLFFIGLILLFCHCRKSGGSFITLGFLILFLFSLSFIPDYMLSKLEYRYPPLMVIPDNINTIVVLGGGVGGQKGYPANTRLNSASLSRLVEAIRLYRELASKGVQAKLILSGGRVFRSPSEAGRIQNTAIILGINAKQIAIEDGSQDTWHEALYLKPKLGEQRFILVTSAYHMPRAMAMFEKLNMHPIAAPTQYLVKLNRNPFRNFIPSSMNLLYADIALHEYIGIVWAKIEHQI